MRKEKAPKEPYIYKLCCEVFDEEELFRLSNNSKICIHCYKNVILTEGAQPPPVD